MYTCNIKSIRNFIFQAFFTEMRKTQGVTEPNLDVEKVVFNSLIIFQYFYFVSSAHVRNL